MRLDLKINKWFLAIYITLIFCIPVIGVELGSGSVSGVSQTISGRYDIAEIDDGNYIIQNNVWGATTSQTIYVPDNTVCEFNVTESSHAQDGVAAYPSVFKGSHWGTATTGWQSTKIENLDRLTFNWSVSAHRPTGKYNIAAEAWFSPLYSTEDGYANGGELMIWMDTQGMVPAGSHVGDYGAYEVWYADFGWDYVCYFLDETSSADIDLLAFIEDSLSRGYLNETWYFHDIEAGFELCSGGEGLMLTSFEASMEGNDTIAPTLSIHFPWPGSQFGSDAPSLTLIINDNTLGEAWYTTNYTETNYSFDPVMGENHVLLNESLWESIDDGDILLTVHIEDSYGNLIEKSVKIIKSTESIPDPGQSVDTVAGFSLLFLVSGILFLFLKRKILRRLDE